MAEKRTESLMFLVEPAIKTKLLNAAARSNMSLSSYLRRVSIETLKQANLLTDAELLKIIEG